MSGLQCIVGGLRGGGRLLRSLHQVQNLSLSSERLLLRPYGPRPPQQRLQSQDQNRSGSAPKLKLRTRLVVTLLFGGGVLATWSTSTWRSSSSCGSSCSGSLLEQPDSGAPAGLSRFPGQLGCIWHQEEVKHAGQDYRVYANAGPKDEDGDYIVDLISPDGLFLDYYNRTKTQEQITENIRNHMKNYVQITGN
ncbi:protein SCO2 homolog, mitochondrial [Lates japonicus]|uniref:Protein SCO2 homolog, mitochondrial n=1 Tax=Lates japonicus TaxID=270547 RepID=A0AAD3NAJ1_LATJO|nr:protein SCO2 homolog, mitochondrial [Lates japonicus]